MRISDMVHIKSGHPAQTDMTQGKILPVLMRYALPILLSQLLQQLYHAADTAVIGHFAGALALASISSGAQLTSVVINFFVGLSAGMSVTVAGLYGNREHGALGDCVRTCVTVSAVFGAVCTVAGLCCAEPFLRYLRTPAEIFADSKLYLTIIFFGTVPQLLYNVCAAILRAVGDTRTPLLFLLISSGLNVAADLLLVAVFSLGVAGAAYATLGSQILAAVLVTVYLARADAPFALKRPGVSGKYVKLCVTKGLPAGMQAVFMSISTLVIRVYINSFGYAAIAGMTIYGNIEGFLYHPLFSFGLAITTFVGQNAGARKYDRVQECIRISIYLAVAASAAMSVLLIFTAKYMAWTFTTDEDVIRNGLQAIYYNFPFYFLYAANQIYIGCIRGIGNTAYPAFTSLCSYCIFRVLWCSVLLRYFNDMRVVYTSYDASWIVMIALLWIGKRVFVDKKCRAPDGAEEKTE